MDYAKHLLYALVISVGWVVIAGLLMLIPTVGEIVLGLIMMAWIWGGLYYALKEVKGVTNGIMAGILYAIVFAIVAIVFHYISWGGALPIIGFGGDWALFFGWPGWWLPLIGFIVFAAFVSWVNEK